MVAPTVRGKAEDWECGGVENGRDAPPLQERLEYGVLRWLKKGVLKERAGDRWSPLRCEVWRERGDSSPTKVIWGMKGGGRKKYPPRERRVSFML